MATLRIACLQSAGNAGEPAANAAELDGAARRAADGGVSLLITPELFLTGYDIGADLGRWAEEPLVRRASEIARQHGIHLLVGVPEREGQDVYNRAVHLDRSGAVRGRYSKAHLFGPLDREHFAAGGRSFMLTDVDGVTVAVLICYDVEFPEAVRAAAMAGAELIAVPTAQMEPFAFVATTMIPVRAWENQVYVAYANRIGTEGSTKYVGRSSIVGPDGCPLAEGGAGTCELLVATVDTATVAEAQRRNPYLADRRPHIYDTAGVDDA